MSKKNEVLAYIQQHPGCTSSGVNKAVRNDQSFTDWVYTRREIDGLVDDGVVTAFEKGGITRFYMKDAE